MLVASKSGGAITAVQECGLTQSQTQLAVLDHPRDGSGSAKGAPARAPCGFPVEWKKGTFKNAIKLSRIFLSQQSLA
jgi:hypothetical protein